ncbi:MAG: adenosylcobinamide-GDP ribazoletransferase [Candidatus Binatia bacterium]
MGIGAEVAAAACTAVPLGRARRPPRAALAGGLAFWPLAGAAVGLAAAGGALIGGHGGALAAVAILELSTGGRGRSGLAAAVTGLAGRGGPDAVVARLRGRPSALGWSVAIAMLAVELWAVATLAQPARGWGLVLAPMLGRWAIAVQCYGTPSPHARGTAAAMIGRAGFREFGIASVVALGLTQEVGFVGVLLALAAALVTVAVRVLVHRRLGGFTGRLLWAAGELVEAAVLVLLSGLAIS